MAPGFHIIPVSANPPTGPGIAMQESSGDPSVWTGVQLCDQCYFDDCLPETGWCGDGQPTGCSTIEIQVDLNSVGAATYDCNISGTSPCSALLGTYIAEFQSITSGVCQYRASFTTPSCVSGFVDVYFFFCGGLRYAVVWVRYLTGGVIMGQQRSGFTENCGEVDFSLPDPWTVNSSCAGSPPAPECGAATINIKALPV